MLVSWISLAGVVVDVASDRDEEKEEAITSNKQEVTQRSGTRDAV